MKWKFHKKGNSQNRHKSKRHLNQGAFDKFLISWPAPEYTHHEKSIWWFAIAAVIVLLLAYYGLRTNGWTFSVAILVFAGTYYLVARQKPPVVEVKISNIGVKIGHHVFPYNHLKNFWIVYDPPFVNKLYLRSSSKLKPDVFVSLDGAEVHEVRKILREHLDELSGKHEPFSDSLVRLFKL